MQCINESNRWKCDLLQKVSWEVMMKAIMTVSVGRAIPTMKVELMLPSARVLDPLLSHLFSFIMGV